MKISATIICKNEERNITRCIESLLGVADEIIVVDSFSTDSTPKICQSYPQVRFVQQTWLGYSAQKNFANQLATNDFILSIDADEALSESLQNSLLALKKNGANHDAYTFNRLTNYCGRWIRHSGWYPDAKLRLWDRRKGSWQGMIHEEIKMLTGSKIGHLKGDLLHYSYYSVIDHLRQMTVYTEIMAKDNIAKGKKATFNKLILSPLFKFFQSYFLQLGFLDGFYGLVVCTLSAYATFLKYLRTKELEENIL